MSIESSLVKLADKIDAQGASNVKPDYKNPNNSIEKSIDRIADNYEAGGGTGMGVYVVNVSVTEQSNFDEYTCDKTAGEILSALKTSLVLFVVENDYVYVVINGGPKLDGYSFLTIGASTNMEYSCVNSDEYPHYEDHF